MGLLLLGCSNKPGGGFSPVSTEGMEPQVRQRFHDLQAALTANDADKLWELLAAKSQKDADQIARSVRETYDKAGAEEKAKLEETLGLPGAELAALSGKGYLKTKLFRNKFREVPESKIDKVTFVEHNATVYFHEPDGDKEKAIFILEDGGWKAWLTVPKPVLGKSEK
jgi:hypothetical protein